MTDRFNTWRALWQWRGFDWEDKNLDQWEQEKELILYNGLDMEAAFFAGYQEYKKERLDNISLRAQLDRANLLLEANVRVMRMEIKKEMEEDALNKT